MQSPIWASGCARTGVTDGGDSGGARHPNSLTLPLTLTRCTPTLTLTLTLAKPDPNQVREIWGKDGGRSSSSKDMEVQP